MSDNGFPYQSLYDFLEKKNVLQKSEDVIRRAKQEYERLYQQHYQKHYKQKRRQVNILLEQTLYTAIKQRAEEQEMSLAKYVRLSLKEMLSNFTSSLPNELIIDIENILLLVCDNLDALIKRFPELQTDIKDIISLLEGGLEKLDGV